MLWHHQQLVNIRDKALFKKSKIISESLPLSARSPGYLFLHRYTRCGYKGTGDGPDQDTNDKIKKSQLGQQLFANGPRQYHEHYKDHDGFPKHTNVFRHYIGPLQRGIIPRTAIIKTKKQPEG